MMIKKLLVFDMDGTIADLYGVENWLDYLRAENALPYEIAEPLYNMEEMREVLSTLKNKGYLIAVTTWLAKESSEQYKKAVAEVKKAWLEKYGFPYDFFHAVQYGTCKRYPTSPRKEYKKGRFYPIEQILFDDSIEVRKDWEKWHSGKAVDANKNILEILKKMLDR